MAFDYGSIDLGLKNPFKLEGKVTALRGIIESVAGVSLLVIAASSVKESTTAGWILMLFGMFILALGIRSLSSGIYATLKYFVGRNHPTSLAYNFSKSESSTAQEEKKEVAYNAQSLEEMLVGRKNSTFKEPNGFLSRLLHSLIPKLLFLPYPIRNVAQRLFGSWVSTLVALVAYGLVAFVSLSGFTGEAGELAFPVYSAILMFYVLFSWRSSSKPISRNAERNIEALGGGTLAKIISLSFILPIVIGLSMSWLMQEQHISKQEIDAWMAQLPNLHAGIYLIAIIILATLSCALVFTMIKARLNAVTPTAEVSELRENWQESVHPDEVFINLDNLVMANRRYKEVPNRVYRELDPKLQEQIEGKGGFKGEMIQEVQPKLHAMELGKNFTLARLIALISANLLYIVALALTVLLAYSLIDIYYYIDSANINNLQQAFNNQNVIQFSSLLMSSVHILIIAVIIKAFARLLANCAHLFFAEMQFESLLVYFKCEGTFTESKISTGTGIHDSTRSENTLVRSSITPWVIVSRVITSTFAATGMKNLEHPRHIMEMHKDEGQLQAIKNDVIAFLKDRESIASITSERDLGNASQIHQLNQQTRAIPTQQAITKEDEEAAGYLRQEENLTPEPKA
ncbi:MULTISPECIES: hypothetical protein [Pseudoalteromonas]|uniref:hypothetical protein n=1 Tax=Pseudoalteromonas TaxID=53246 RepID=UPI0002C9F1F2|nr:MULTISPECIES: hypothetical protein [Pseudoalteromonas]ENO00462.1 hypothetical protein J139_02461 [Pseudoalteromonas agarivorans S816]MDC9496595.1 hypothetical protein [Pseudoalteromonas sp. Angola-20]MDC9516348.1 hypothetical protein [Pseudoalteromonas sp. Angola-22]MDC9532756.1 hypothetical protein [Pseudoalteromonas sp. Angola-9]MDI3244299.1 hypothetical protein [Pseudoalteromonas agarivorans]